MILQQMSAVDEKLQVKVCQGFVNWGKEIENLAVI
jgi:hypothetical protein